MDESGDNALREIQQFMCPDDDVCSSSAWSTRTATTRAVQQDWKAILPYFKVGKPRKSSSESRLLGCYSAATWLLLGASAGQGPGRTAGFGASVAPWAVTVTVSHAVSVTQVLRLRVGVTDLQAVRDPGRSGCAGDRRRRTVSGRAVEVGGGRGRPGPGARSGTITSVPGGQRGEGGGSAAVSGVWPRSGGSSWTLTTRPWPGRVGSSRRRAADRQRRSSGASTISMSSAAIAGSHALARWPAATSAPQSAGAAAAREGGSAQVASSSARQLRGSACPCRHGRPQGPTPRSARPVSEPTAFSVAGPRRRHDADSGAQRRTPGLSLALQQTEVHNLRAHQGFGLDLRCAGRLLALAAGRTGRSRCV